MIAFIGPKDMLAFLGAFGMEVFPAETEAQAAAALENAAAQNKFNIIYIVERLAANLMQRIDELNQNPALNIVLIPDNRTSLGLAQKRIDRLIRESIGASVLIRK